MTDRVPHAVLEQVTARMITPLPALYLEVDLSYTPADPYAIRAVFCADTDWPVPWIIARGILAAGLHGGPAGHGDVRAWAVGSGQTLAVELRAQWRAVLEFPARPVREFLARTWDLVPSGTENIQVAAELAAFLAQATGDPGG